MTFFIYKGEGFLESQSIHHLSSSKDDINGRNFDESCDVLVSSAENYIKSPESSLVVYETSVQTGKTVR